MAASANAKRIERELLKLKNFDSCPEMEGITRLWFSEEEVLARGYIKQLMSDAGLYISEDAIGNIYGTLPGEEANLSPIWSGSHIDTVRNAGAFDGTVGVIGAIEALRVIRENNIKHRRDIVALVFSSEEPSRFGIGCVGSRAMAGHLSLEETKQYRDDNGISIYEELKRRGYLDMDFEKTVIKHAGDVFASVELHIEQAPLLEKKGIPIGVVDAICAPSYIHVLLQGQQEHAGSTPMNARKDAMVAASEIIVEIESLARKYGNSHTVATVGRVIITPNSQNVIAGTVEFVVDIRDKDEATKTDLTNKICAFIENTAKLRDMRVQFKITADDLPRDCDKRIMDVIGKSCKAREIPDLIMTSGAYHDSLLIAEFAPIGMIFLPSKDGISHDPAEYTSLEDIVRGVNILTDTLATLSNMDSL